MLIKTLQRNSFRVQVLRNKVQFEFGVGILIIFPVKSFIKALALKYIYLPIHTIVAFVRRACCCNLSCSVVNMEVEEDTDPYGYYNGMWRVSYKL